jgi:hypothetical protein
MRLIALTSATIVGAATLFAAQTPSIGRELAIARHLGDGEELTLSIARVIAYGGQLFAAPWTDQDGGGRPNMTGTGRRLADPSRALTGARRFNRISGPDANACRGCHVSPFQEPGGGGDFVANAFVMAERFDFVTFARGDAVPTRGGVDERGRPVTLRSVGNSRLTPGLWGAGYLEMIAREMSVDLQRIRDSVAPGEKKRLVSKGVSFGTLARGRGGAWIVDGVEGLPRQSVTRESGSSKPTLLVHPWRQSGSVVSLREMTVVSFNAHHGMQATERFGIETDPDGDGVVNELTRADITAATLWEATRPVPGQVNPHDPARARAVRAGEQLFRDFGCATCHIPALPLSSTGSVYSEPNPFNGSKILRPGQAPAVRIDLGDQSLPQPRLPQASDGTVWVPAFTDFKLHDITDPADPDAAEPVDINEQPGTDAFTRGNRKFLTRRLWGVGNQASYFHHGLFTSLRQAVVAHAGQAADARRAFDRASKDDQDALLEFLASLQVLPPGTRALLVEESIQADCVVAAVIPTLLEPRCVGLAR